MAGDLTVTGFNPSKILLACNMSHDICCGRGNKCDTNELATEFTLASKIGSHLSHLHNYINTIHHTSWVVNTTEAG